MKPELEEALELIKNNSDGAFVTILDNGEITTKYNLNSILLLDTVRRMIDIVLATLIEEEKHRGEVKIISPENESVN